MRYHLKNGSGLLLLLQFLPFFFLCRDLLDDTLVAFVSCFQSLKKIGNTSLADLGMPDMIVDDDRFLTQRFHRFGESGDGILDCLRDFGKRRFQFKEHSVVRFDLTVKFTAVGNQAAAFHRLSNVAFVDRRLLVNTSGGVTAVVNVSIGAIGFIKIFVRGLRPILTPCYKLLVAVPTGSDRILPSELSAFRIFVGSLIAVLLRL